MVDLVCRVVVESDGTRKLQFKSNEVIFGGGRLQGVKTTECPLSWDALMGVYKEALNSQKPNTAHMNKVEEFRKSHTEPTQEPKPEEVQAHAEDTPVEVTRRERRVREVEPEVNTVETVEEPTQTVEAPVRRTRRVRGE